LSAAFTSNQQFMATTEIPTHTSPGVDPNGSGLRSGSDVNGQRLPVVLLELQDKLSRSRVREALWLSVMLHLFVIIAVSTMPHWVPNYQTKPFIATDIFKNQEQTFLALPPDLEKVTEKPKTDVLSDKDRIAQSRHPDLNRKELRKIIESSRPGPPAAPAQQMASAAPPPQPQMPPSQQPNAAGGQQLGSGGPPLPQQNQAPKLESLAPGGATRRGNNPFAAALSPGANIEEAARATATNRGAGGGGAGGDYGVAPRTNANVQGGLEVLSDTQGVDFGPYLERVVFKVKTNWYLVIPDSVRAPLYKRGKVSIDFAIQKDGSIAGMRVIGPSGDVYLDRAAWSGITASNPFPPLPTQFTGPYLALRFHFFYNPDKNDLQ
jgi:TonB family protein